MPHDTEPACGVDPVRDGDCWNPDCREHNPESAAELSRADGERIMRRERERGEG